MGSKTNKRSSSGNNTKGTARSKSSNKNVRPLNEQIGCIEFSIKEDDIELGSSDTLLTVKKLIERAFGAPDQNRVDFKLLQMIFHFLANNLKLLDNRVLIQLKPGGEEWKSSGKGLNTKVDIIKKEGKILKPKGNGLKLEDGGLMPESNILIPREDVLSLDIDSNTLEIDDFKLQVDKLKKIETYKQTVDIVQSEEGILQSEDDILKSQEDNLKSVDTPKPGFKILMPGEGLLESSVEQLISGKGEELEVEESKSEVAMSGTVKKICRDSDVATEIISRSKSTSFSVGSKSEIESIDVVTKEEFEALEIRVNDLINKVVILPLASSSDSDINILKDKRFSLQEDNLTKHYSKRLQAVEDALERMDVIMKLVTDQLQRELELEVNKSSDDVSTTSTDSEFIGVTREEVNKMLNDVQLYMRDKADRLEEKARKSVENAIRVAKGAVETAMSISPPSLVASIDTLKKLVQTDAMDELINTLVTVDKKVKRIVEAVSEFVLEYAYHETLQLVMTTVKYGGTGGREAIKDLNEKYQEMLKTYDGFLYYTSQLNTEMKEFIKEVDSYEMFPVLPMLELKANHSDLWSKVDSKMERSGLEGLLSLELFEDMRQNIGERMEQCDTEFQNIHNKWMEKLNECWKVANEATTAWTLRQLRADVNKVLQQILAELHTLEHLFQSKLKELMHPVDEDVLVCGVCQQPADAAPPVERDEKLRLIQKKCTEAFLKIGSEKRVHYSKRWVGGSHTLLKNQTLQKPPQLRLQGHAVGDQFHDELSPCLPCNRIDLKFQPQAGDIENESICLCEEEEYKDMSKSHHDLALPSLSSPKNRDKQVPITVMDITNFKGEGDEGKEVRQRCYPRMVRSAMEGFKIHDGNVKGRKRPGSMLN